MVLGDRYRIEAQLGCGGMSTVFRAYDQKLERIVAIKRLQARTASDPTQLERFAREAKAVARLSHPHIVGVIDVGEIHGHPYIVLEYVAGETLKERISRNGPLGITEAVAYTIEIARALGAAHDQNIVHRDIKPQNILIDEDGDAKVTDFGIACALDQDTLTDKGRVIGSTDYVSPEQALGKAVSGQSDIYSLGIVLFEMLTGTLPYKASSQVAVALRHVRDQVPDVRVRRAGVSAMLAAVVDRMTAKDLAQRYLNINELVEDLEQVLAVETSRAGVSFEGATTVLRTLPEPMRQRVPLRVRRPTFAIGTSLLTIVGLVGLLLALAGSTQRGTGSEGAASVGGMHEISLGQKAARDFDPIGGDREHPEQASFVVDRDPNTTWSSEHYEGGHLGKEGVGIYVAAPHSVVAKELRVHTPTPGWDAVIYGAHKYPPPDELHGGWVRLDEKKHVDQNETFNLHPGGHEFRYYLVWITGLPPDTDQVQISEIKLFR